MPVQICGGRGRRGVGEGGLLEKSGGSQIPSAGFLLWFGCCEVSPACRKSDGGIQPRQDGKFAVGLHVPFPFPVIVFVPGRIASRLALFHTCYEGSPGAGHFILYLYWCHQDTRVLDQSFPIPPRRKLYCCVVFQS